MYIKALFRKNENRGWSGYSPFWDLLGVCFCVFFWLRTAYSEQVMYFRHLTKVSLAEDPAGFWVALVIIVIVTFVGAFHFLVNYLVALEAIKKERR